MNKIVSEPSSITLPEGPKHFLENEEVCVLAVALPDGGVHVAPLLFVCNMNTLQIAMCTSQLSEKMWWYREGLTSTKASIACGLSKKLPYSLQMRGELRVFQPSEDPVLFEKYKSVASALDDPDNPENIMIIFTPTWARYTDRVTDYSRHQIAL